MSFRHATPNQERRSPGGTCWSALPVSNNDNNCGCLELNVYLPNTRSIPENSNSNFTRESLPTRSVSRDLFREIIWDTFATESFGNPVTRADKATLPGAKAHFKLLVSGTHRAVPGAPFSRALFAREVGLASPRDLAKPQTDEYFIDREIRA